MAPALKAIVLPVNLAMEPESEQLEYVAARIRQHFDERGGQLPLFGPMFGYRFVNQYGQSIRFDTSGNVVERVGQHFEGPGGAIQIGRKTVEPTPLLKMAGSE